MAGGRNGQCSMPSLVPPKDWQKVIMVCPLFEKIIWCLSQGFLRALCNERKGI